MFKMATNTYLSIIILNGNGLKAPTKRYRGVDYIGKQTRTYKVLPAYIGIFFFLFQRVCEFATYLTVTEL